VQVARGTIGIAPRMAVPLASVARRQGPSRPPPLTPSWSRLSHPAARDTPRSLDCATFTGTHARSDGSGVR